MTLTPTTPKQTAQDIEHIITLTTLADSTKGQYRKAIRNALAAGIELTNADELAQYAATLPTSSRAFLKAAIRLWAEAITRRAKGQADPDNVAAIQATVYRFEALNEAIQVKAAKGEKAHFWLSLSEVKKLLATCSDPSIKCQRDKIVLGLLVGAGLRRDELRRLSFDDITHQPIKGKIRTVLGITGKGAKDRVIPIKDTLAAALDSWYALAGPERIARSVNKAGQVGRNLSPVAIFKIVNGAGKSIGYPDLAPHDLRRTYAQIGYDAGVPITQISKLLGHSSVATTQRYLNLELDLETTISDFVPFD